MFPDVFPGLGDLVFWTSHFEVVHVHYQKDFRPWVKEAAPPFSAGPNGKETGLFDACLAMTFPVTTGVWVPVEGLPHQHDRVFVSTGGAQSLPWTKTQAIGLWVV